MKIRLRTNLFVLKRYKRLWTYHFLNKKYKKSIPRLQITSKCMMNHQISTIKYA